MIGAESEATPTIDEPGRFDSTPRNPNTNETRTMATFDKSLFPGRLLRQAEPPKQLSGWAGADIRDPRLGRVLRPDARLDIRYQFTLHGEGTIWDPVHDRLL